MTNLYSKKGCFATSSMVNTNSHYFRGCSAFESEKDEVCKDVIEIGMSGLSCKSSCVGDNCNIEPITLPLTKCFVCSITVNHKGQIMAESDIGCDTLEGGEKYLQSCFSDANYCASGVIAEWHPTLGQVSAI